MINEDYEVRLIDFGSSEPVPRYEKDWYESFKGTVEYASPECLQHKRHPGTPADVWALGVMMYVIAFKAAPFDTPQEAISEPLPMDPDEPNHSPGKFLFKNDEFERQEANSFACRNN